MSTATSSYRRLLREVGYLRVFVAGLGSVGGSAVAGVCTIWIVAVETGSTLDVAVLGTVQLAAGILFSLVGGTLVDRYDRRRLMVLSDFVRAATIAVLVVDLEVWGFNLWGFLAAMFVVSAFSTVFNPAEQAVVPSLVGPELVPDANGLIRSTRSAVGFAGAAVAGALIVTVGPVAGLATNIGTFVFSGSLLTGLVVASPRRASAPVGARSSYMADLVDGFRWLRRARGLLDLTLSAGVFNFCYTVIGTFLVFFATEVLHGSALLFASLLAVEVAGTAIGSLLVGRVDAVRWAGKAWVVPYGIVSGAVAVLLAVLPVPLVSLAALFALGLFGGFAGTAWLTAAQLLVPTEMQGRYFGIDSLGSWAIIPVGQIGGAVLIAEYGLDRTYLLAGVLWVVAGIAFLVSRPLWRLSFPPAPEDEASYRAVDGASGRPGSPGESRPE
ncbi:MAG TPA: MFS transporter [Thermoplasmata archaeon]|nr:MFS transporter [Thermoplasmata archaeon]